jgi:fibronectin-binding autotransporter adhesin
LGTNVTNLSQHTFTFAGDTPIIFDIQDPDNTFTWDKNYSSQANGASATYAFNKAGLGTLVVTTNQTYQNIQGAAIVTVLSGGTMKVDYPAGGRLNNVYNNIGFTGGTLHLLGKPDGTVTQTFQNVKLNAGGGTLIVDNQGGSGSTLANLGNFTSLAPVQGGGLDIRTVNAGSGSALVRSTGTNDATGLLGSGRVTLNGTDWAAVDATSNVVAYTGYTVGLPSSGSSPSVNYSHTDSASVTASESVNTLKLATTTGGQSLSIGAGQILTAGPVLFTGANDYTITGGSLAGALIAGGVSDFQIHHHGTGKLTIGSSITNGVGASILTIHGPGTTELTTANLYTGATRVNGGTLILSNNNQLNNGANTTLVLNGAKLKADDSITTSRTVTLGAGGATLDIATGKTLTLSGTVSGGRLILENSDAGSGLLVLGAVNSFASGVEVNGGVLRLNNNSALHALGLNTLQFGTASTQTLQIYGARTITVAGLKSDATTAVVENGATGAAILNVYNGADNRYTGVLRDGTVGTLALRKAGCGRLTLTGANTYTGTTTVWGGTLAVDGSLASASAVTVTRGALGGTGTAGGTVTVEAGGALAPGNGVGTLATGALTLNPGAILDYEMGSTGNADRVNVTGNLTLDGVLNVTDLAGFGAGQYTLITYTGTLTNNGLDVGTIPDDGLVYTVKTNTPGSVILSAAGPGSVILVR